MRKIIFIICLLLAQKIMAQPLNNEWIDYAKTYYKFNVGKTGVYRISQAVLASINIQNTPVEQFQLWRNGKQVALFTSINSGILTSTDFIEFWGEQNDGIPDLFLYANPVAQANDKLSLQTDTAAFFLTVNANVNNNLRHVTAINDVANNTLSADPFFMYSYRVNFRDRINRGFNRNVGEPVSLSTYDIGEGFGSREINLANPLTQNATNLFAFNGTQNATITVGVAANAEKNRGIDIGLNNTSIITQNLNGFTAKAYTNAAIPVNLLNNTNDVFRLKITTSDSFDRVVCRYIDFAYPRQFNFGGSSNFSFSLPSNSQGNFLVITNFNNGIVAPVLYDVSTNRRYVGNTVNAGSIRFALPPRSSASNFVLVSQETNNINTVSGLQQRNFINYAQATNQGDYLIISNKILMTGANAVEQYRQYRSSPTGGGFNAKIYDIDELVDQFAYGIKKHPLSVKNFIRYATSIFSKKPSTLFIIGKATTYEDYRINESNSLAERLNLVPTWGWPASDVLLVSNSFNPIPSVEVGRLSAVMPQEIITYLDKVKQFEQQALSTNQTLAGKGWMKQMVHVAGANDASLDQLLTSYLRGYENIARDTVFGATVNNFGKSTTGAVTSITNQEMGDLFASGINLLTYFGHSAATALDYNLNDPQAYNNPGKYPFFLVNGCSAGNFFDFDAGRFSTTTSLAEKFVLAPQRGAIGFVASTHFGLTTYLDNYSTGFYRSLSKSGYGKSIGTNIYDGIIALQNTSSNFSDYFARQHAEQILLHGDPALKLYSHAKPDFLIESNQVTISPNIISVADNQFAVKIKMFNIGKASGDSVRVLIRRNYPDGTTDNMYNKNIKSVRYMDSLVLNAPIIASRDRGNNSITVTIDSDGKYDELSEINNSITKTFVIFDDELKPIYPYNFSIINKPTIKLMASTANPLSQLRNYVMEIDTTELFNSSFKIIKNTSAIGGVIEFDAGITFRDSTVYYWRVGQVPPSGIIRFNTSSFQYLAGTSVGFGQSHLYQQFKSDLDRINLDSISRLFSFKNHQSLLQIVHSIFPTSGTNAADFSVILNGLRVTASACVGNSIIFNVFDPITLKPYFNQAIPSTTGSGVFGGFMGTGFPCVQSGSNTNFEVNIQDINGRNKLRDFMDWIPTGAYVSARLIFNEGQVPLANIWKNDELINGINNTMYSRLKQVGFVDIDSFNRSRTFAFVYQKNTSAFVPQSKFSIGLFDQIRMNINLINPDTLGYISSPTFGPVYAWKQLQWRGSSLENNSNDVATIDLFGINNSGLVTKLQTIPMAQQNVDISTIDATQYPYLKMVLKNQDNISLTPYQLRYWRLIADVVPEGAVAPNIKYSIKDTLELGEPLNISVAFKNTGDVAFRDSLSVKLQVLDKNNVTTTLPTTKLKRIASGDTTVFTATIDTRNFIGANTLFININPEFDQPEQYLFNNFIYKNFLVKEDDKKPILDVTFDGIHILNNDIVSAKPAIRIKLKDDNKFLAINDTALATVQLRYPNNSLKQFKFNTDTLRFTPPTNPQIDNSATIDFTPLLLQDGMYELMVTGKDRSNNTSGNQQYKVSFQVYNKAMISNVFNYPNPFTTSTAFAFTLTGTQVPQNIKIQILTITGKIVKEITSAELGYIHIGNNITDYKWDGTDMFGGKLANGVYLYRVVTNLNGSSLDKFNTLDRDGNKVNTDKYFKAGYGKMYLMR